MFAKIKKIFLEFIFVGFVLYIGFCAFAYFFPELIYYAPTKQASNLENAHKKGYMASEVHYHSADGTNLPAWMTKPTSKDKIIVFMHGNSYNIEYFINKLKPLSDAGYGTFIGEYRGFGNVEGKISEENLKKDAMAAVLYLNSIGYKNEDIILYGMSLGSHTAVNTAYQLKENGRFAALILEVPFDSMTAVVKKVSPVYIPPFIVRDKYDNLSIIKEVDTKLLVMGGEKDTLVPVELAKNLFKEAKAPKSLRVYKEGKHSNLHILENYNDILAWLEINEKR